MKLQPPPVAPAASFTVRRLAADCIGKQAFECFGRADKVARHMRRRGRRDGRSSAPYRCDHCGARHIGTGESRRKSGA